MDKAQVAALSHGAEVHYGDCSFTVGPRGGVRVKQERWRISGMMRYLGDSWRRPIKHGMRTSDQIDPRSVEAFHTAASCDLGDRIEAALGDLHDRRNPPLRRCNACGVADATPDAGGCTNGRCRTCHGSICGEGERHTLLRAGGGQ